MFNAFVDDLKEDLGIAILERYDDGCESEDEATLRIYKMIRIVEEICDVDELKDVKEDVKREKCVEGVDKRIVNAEREKERDLIDAHNSDSKLDSSDDNSEEERGDLFHKLFDGQVYCMCLILFVMFCNV